MALINTAARIQEYIHYNPAQLESSKFILAYAPFCAKHMDSQSTDGKIYMNILDNMFRTHEYTIPFYYIGFLKHNSENTSAANCKGFLRSMCSDLDRITTWYKSNGLCSPNDKDYINSVTSNLIECVKTFITGVRKYQLETGANESVIANYSPFIPYQYKTTRDTELNTSYNKLNTLDIVHGYIDKECNIEQSEIMSYLSKIAMQYTNEIIDNIDLPFCGWASLMDMFNDITNKVVNISEPVLLYLALIWSLNQEYPINAEIFNTQLQDFKTLINHKYVPLKKNEFNGLFESMCNYYNGNIEEELMTTEAWSALSEDSQEYMDKILEKVPKADLMDSTYNLDALLSHFYSMRHVETNDYTNQFFLAEVPDIVINSYNYINDNILVCEIFSSLLIIPYIDITSDYQTKFITINKSNEIENYDMDGLKELCQMKKREES